MFFSLNLNHADLPVKLSSMALVPAPPLSCSFGPASIPLHQPGLVFLAQGDIIFGRATDLRPRIIIGYRHLLMLLQTSPYTRFVTQAGRHLSAFFFPQSSTAFRLYITRVYRKTSGSLNPSNNRGGKTEVPHDIHTYLLDHGLVVAPETPASRLGRAIRVTTRGKYLPVFCFAWKPTPHSSPHFYYTIILTLPQQPPSGQFEEVEWGSVQYDRKALRMRDKQPKVGLTSWFDTEAINQAEQNLLSRRLPVHTGHPGRPVLSKMGAGEASHLPLAMRDVPRAVLPPSYQAQLIEFEAGWAAEHAEADEADPAELEEVYI